MKCNESNWFQVNRLKIIVRLVNKMIARDGSDIMLELGGKFYK